VKALRFISPLRSRTDCSRRRHIIFNPAIHHDEKGPHRPAVIVRVVHLLSDASPWRERGCRRGDGVSENGPYVEPRRHTRSCRPSSNWPRQKGEAKGSQRRQRRGGGVRGRKEQGREHEHRGRAVDVEVEEFDRRPDKARKEHPPRTVDAGGCVPKVRRHA
jgi:hypothetical protein